MKVLLYGRQIDLGPTPSRHCLRRWLGQLAPEPETIAWIESLPPHGVFFDIGASVGTHAVRAALRGLSVHTFEAEPVRAQELAAIVTRNRLPIRTNPVPLHRRAEMGKLVSGPGKRSFFADPAGRLQAITVDIYARKIACPDYIKLDVDGNELGILQGAVKTLPNVKSLLVEVDPNAGLGNNGTIPEFLAGYGFRFDPEQVARCRIPSGKFAGAANYIFWRP